jgi:hypothetical protein
MLPTEFTLNSVSVQVILPNYDTFIFNFHVFPEITTVEDFMVSMIEQELTTLHLDEMKLVYIGCVMERNELYSSYSVKSVGDCIHMLQIMVPIPISIEYKNFLRSSYPEPTSVDFPVDSDIILKFGKNRLRKVQLYIPALIDSKIIEITGNGDMVEILGSKKEALKKGLVQWTDETVSQRVHLLELSDSLKGFAFTDYSNLERLRYSSTGTINRGYNKGDCHSWQRYTNKMPLLCNLTEIIEMEDSSGEDISVVHLKPEKQLLFDTYYCILLCNNVPTFPVGCLDSDFLGTQMYVHIHNLKI